MPVQHHHAHALSCIVENEPALLSEPIVAVMLDGTGYGTDGRIWGGEWLVVEGAAMSREAHLKYVPLVGEDAAAGWIASPPLISWRRERMGWHGPCLSWPT